MWLAVLVQGSGFVRRDLDEMRVRTPEVDRPGNGVIPLLELDPSSCQLALRVVVPLTRRPEGEVPVAVAPTTIAGGFRGRGRKERDASRSRHEHRWVVAPLLREDTPKAERLLVPLRGVLDVSDRQGHMIEHLELHQAPPATGAGTLRSSAATIAS